MIFNCPKCDKSIKVADEKAGKKGKCPGCGEILTIPVAVIEEPVEEIDDLDEVEEKKEDVEKRQEEADERAALNAELIRREIDPVIESVKRLSDLSEKALAISQNLQLIQQSLGDMKGDMEQHLNRVLTVLEPADEHNGGSPAAGPAAEPAAEAASEAAPAESSEPKAGPFTEEELKKAAVQIANEKRGEFRCLSCRSVWIGRNRLLGANPTDAFRCPNGCNQGVVL
jgi:hypothetical protein